MLQMVILQAGGLHGGMTGTEYTYFLLLIVFLFLNGKIAKWKGYPFWVGAISGIVLFWGTILFLLMPFNQKKKNLILCPYCREKIMGYAKKCKHCGEWLDGEDIPNTQEQSKQQSKNNLPNDSASEISQDMDRSSQNKVRLDRNKYLLGILIALTCVGLGFGIYYLLKPKQEQLYLMDISTNQDEYLRKEIIGNYSFVQTDGREEDAIVTMSGTSAFKSNGVCETEGTMTFYIIDEDGYESTLKYKFEMYAKYEIKNSYIIYDFKIENIGITLIQSDNYELSRLINDHYISQMKSDMITDNKEKIFELTDRYLKTEENVDGEKKIMTYIRLSEK